MRVWAGRENVISVSTTVDTLIEDRSTNFCRILKAVWQAAATESLYVSGSFIEGIATAFNVGALHALVNSPFVSYPFFLHSVKTVPWKVGVSDAQLSL